MKYITIFTPTYNRQHTLPRLYESLKKQTCKDFLWLVVDDGSTDDTYSLVENWCKEGFVNIEYIYQENQGKAMAHNLGVELTKTRLFTCVDSDDFLIDNAIEIIIDTWESKCVNMDFCTGILGFRGNNKGESITHLSHTNIRYSKLRELYLKYGMSGDTMLIFKTSIISIFKFPRFNKEKFVPEAFLYDLIDQIGELYIVQKVLYVCEYLDDGYTKNINSLLIRNPLGYLAFIKQRLSFDTCLKSKILNTIRYTAMCIASKQKGYIRNSVYPNITLLTWFGGYFLSKIKYAKAKSINVK